MSKKSIVGSAGRFGVRYGDKIRVKVADIEKFQKQRHACPQCNMKFVTRVSSGIWKCKKCGVKFSGLAYLPKSQSIREEK